jgi:hypothetical protein
MSILLHPTENDDFQGPLSRSPLENSADLGGGLIVRQNAGFIALIPVVSRFASFVVPGIQETISSPVHNFNYVLGDVTGYWRIVASLPHKEYCPSGNMLSLTGLPCESPKNY